MIDLTLVAAGRKKKTFERPCRCEQTGNPVSSSETVGCAAAVRRIANKLQARYERQIGFQ